MKLIYENLEMIFFRLTYLLNIMKFKFHLYFII